VEPRPLRVLATATALGAAVVAVSAAGTSVATVSSRTNAALGKILVGAGGRTLYSERKALTECTGSCAVQWPPLVIGARAKPIAGPGVKASLLGTVKRPDGRLQVSYRGQPLFLFAGDAKAGDVNGQAVGATWHALTPSGAAVTKLVSSSSTGSTPGDSAGSGSSMGTGSSTGVNTGMWCAANPNSCVNGVPVTGAH